jgi:hypothetical protein
MNYYSSHSENKAYLQLVYLKQICNSKQSVLSGRRRVGLVHASGEAANAECFVLTCLKYTPKSPAG